MIDIIKFLIALIAGASSLAPTDAFPCPTDPPPPTCEQLGTERCR